MESNRAKPLVTSERAAHKLKKNKNVFVIVLCGLASICT